MDALRLLAWFDENRRDLPWRREPRDPYAVWVSEVMLQQTRVDTVARYFEPFLARFPDVASLAQAPEDAVMKAWEGLGYYRRARLLQAGARAIVAHHGGRIPKRYRDLLELPGFGPYTAGALASLAFAEAVPAVDGNVVRVATRLLALEEDAASVATRRTVDAWARRHQPRERPGAFNEALMELGATVCTPRAPRCAACPVADDCAGRATGAPERFPVKAPGAAPREARVALALAWRGGTLLLEKRDSGLLAGTWGLPWVEVGAREDARALIAQKVASLAGAPAEVGPEPIARGRHVYSHVRWTMEGFRVKTAGSGGEWLEPERVALGTAHRKLLDAVRTTAER